MAFFSFSKCLEQKSNTYQVKPRLQTSYLARFSPLNVIFGDGIQIWGATFGLTWRWSAFRHWSSIFWRPFMSSCLYLMWRSLTTTAWRLSEVIARNIKLNQFRFYKVSDSTKIHLSKLAKTVGWNSTKGWYVNGPLFDLDLAWIEEKSVASFLSQIF